MNPFIFLMMIIISHLGFAASYQPSEKFDYLEQTSKAFTEIAEKNIPAVVLIKTQMQKQRGPTSGFFSPHPDPFFEDFLRRFFGEHRMENSSNPYHGAGSGFFAREDGYIITNHHVIKNANKILIVTHDGKELDATVVGEDPRTDLAVLKVDVQGASCIEFADSNLLVVGEWVVAIGHPYELNHTVTAGIVSATQKTRDHLDKITQLGGLVQTDAAINPGNSGGPLLNRDGNLIGVNVAIASNTGSFTGIGFAIPSMTAKYVFDQIVEQGSVDRAYLGIMLQNIDQELAAATNLTAHSGILITEVLQGSPAQKAGLQNGDIILEMNGTPVKSMNTFRNQIALMPPRTAVALKIRRKETTLAIDVILGVLSELEESAKQMFEKLGIEVEDFKNLSPDVLSRYGHSPSSSGALITGVQQGSPAKAAGIATSQVITGVVIDWNNQRKIGSVQDLRDALKELGDRKHIVLIVRHKNFQRYCTLKIS